MRKAVPEVISRRVEESAFRAPSCAMPASQPSVSNWTCTSAAPGFGEVASFELFHGKEREVGRVLFVFFET